MKTTEYLASRSHEVAIEGLYGAIRDNSNVLALTGETGSGKTTVMRRLSEELAGTARPVFCPSSGLDFTQILNVISGELHIPFKGLTRRTDLDALTQAIASSPFAPITLLVDDADRLHGDALDQLLRLSRAVRRLRGQFHLVLSGLPTLQERLKRAIASHPGTTQAVFARLTKLSDGESTTFMQSLAANRLATSTHRVSATELQRICELGEGVPGRLVSMFDNALAEAERSDEAGLSSVAIDHLATTTQHPNRGPLAPSQSRIRSSDVESVTAAMADESDMTPSSMRTLSRSWRTVLAVGALATFTAAALSLGMLSSTHTENARAKPIPPTIERAASPTPAVQVKHKFEASDQAVARTDILAASTEVAKVENPPAPRPTLSTEQTRTNLDNAWAALDRNALTTPRENNAVQWAQAVLVAKPGEAEAVDVIQAVIDKYLQWTDSNLDRGETQAAARYLNKVQSLDQHASPDQIAAMNVLGSELAKQGRRLAKAQARARTDRYNDDRRQRQASRRQEAHEAPPWLNSIERWLRTLPLPQ